MTSEPYFLAKCLVSRLRLRRIFYQLAHSNEITHGLLATMTGVHLLLLLVVDDLLLQDDGFLRHHSLSIDRRFSDAFLRNPRGSGALLVLSASLGHLTMRQHFHRSFGHLALNLAGSRRDTVSVLLVLVDRVVLNPLHRALRLDLAVVRRQVAIRHQLVVLLLLTHRISDVRVISKGKLGLVRPKSSRGLVIDRVRLLTSALLSLWNGFGLHHVRLHAERLLVGAHLERLDPVVWIGRDFTALFDDVVVRSFLPRNGVGVQISQSFVKHLLKTSGGSSQRIGGARLSRRSGDLVLRIAEIFGVSHHRRLIGLGLHL